MAIRGVALTVTYTAWDTVAGAPKPGDASNHTLKVTKDGTTATASNSPTEITGYSGEYKVTLTSTEMTADFVLLGGLSSTTGVIIIPVKITTEHGLLKGNGTYDLRQILIMAWTIIMSGKIQGLPSSPATVRNFEDSADMATLAFDGNNNRTGITVVTPPP